MRWLLGAPVIGALLIATAAVAWHGGGAPPLHLWLKYGPPLRPDPARGRPLERFSVIDCPRGYGRMPEGALVVDDGWGAGIAFRFREVLSNRLDRAAWTMEAVSAPRTRVSRREVWRESDSAARIVWTIFSKYLYSEGVNSEGALPRWAPPEVSEWGDMWCFGTPRRDRMCGATALYATDEVVRLLREKEAADRLESGDPDE